MNLRIKIGRRKSERIIPLLGLVVIMGLVCWAGYNYFQAQEAEKLNHNLRTVLQEEARLRHSYERPPHLTPTR